MLPDSIEWNNVRNRIYAELRDQKVAQLESVRRQTGQTVTDASQITDVSSYYNLLIVSHDDIDSYQTVNILNYFGFPFEVEEEDYWGSSRKAFQFSKSDPYPYLVMDSSHEEMPNAELVGLEHILSFLYNNSLISTYRSYGVYEKQGLDFTEEKLKPAVDDLQNDWRTLAQFHMRPKHFRQGKMSIEGHTNIKLYCFKLVTFMSQLLTRERTSKTKAELYESVQVALDELQERIKATGEGSLFHGGATPDLVDFRAYSIINKMAHTFVVIQILNDREDPTIMAWYSQMRQLCKPRTQF